MFTKVGVETKWRLLILATWATWSKRSSSIAKPPCPRNVDDAASSQSKLGTIDYKMKNTELLFWQAYILHGYGWFQTQKSRSWATRFAYGVVEGRTRTCDLTSWFKIVNNKQHHPIPTQIPTRKSLVFGIEPGQSGPDWDTELCYSSSASTGSIASSGTRTIAIDPIRIKASSPSISVNWYHSLDAG